MSHPARILHIEDDPAIAQSLQEGLRREGYDVTWHNTGSEGIAFAAARAPHLVILDVRLPDGSGFDVCRQLRQRGLRMPVLMLTVQSDAAHEINTPLTALRTQLDLAERDGNPADVREARAQAARLEQLATSRQTSCPTYSSDSIGPAMPAHMPATAWG